MKDPFDNIEIIDVKDEDIEIIDIEEQPIKTSIEQPKPPLKKPPEEKVATKKSDRIAIISFLVIIVLLILFAIYGKKVIAFIQDRTPGQGEVQDPGVEKPNQQGEGTIIDKNSLNEEMVHKMENVMRVALLQPDQFTTSVSNMNLLYNTTKMGMVYQTLNEDLFVKTNCEGDRTNCTYSISAAVFQKQATKVLGNTVSIRQEDISLNDNVLGICANLTYNADMNEYESAGICNTEAITSPLQGKGILVDFYEYKKNGDELTVAMKYLYREIEMIENEYHYLYYTTATGEMPLFGPLTTVTGTDQTTVEMAKMKEYRSNLSGLKFTFKINRDNTFQLSKIQSLKG